MPLENKTASSCRLDQYLSAGSSSSDTYLWVSGDDLLDRRLESVTVRKDVESDTLESPVGTMGSDQFIEPFLTAAADDDGGFGREIQDCKSEGTTYSCSGSNDEDALRIADAGHDGRAGW
jgi:hypothetical protein